MNHQFIKSLISEAEKKGAELALAELGVIQPEISNRQAVKMYGKTLLKRWENAKLATPIKAGANTSAVRWNRQQLRVAAMTDMIFAYSVGNSN